MPLSVGPVTKKMPRNIVFLEANAIHKVSHTDTVNHGFNMNIAGPHIVGIVEDEVYEPDMAENWCNSPNSQRSALR